MTRLRIEEEPLGHAIWGNLIDIEVDNEDRELKVLEIASKHIKRKHRIFRGGVELKKGLAERIEELRLAKRTKELRARKVRRR